MLLWNKDLFERAGLDPDAAPASWSEIRDAARSVTALGDGVTGFYLAGNCAGCNAFETFPTVWASGGDLLGADGDANFYSPEVVANIGWLNDMWNDGSIATGARSDAGENWLTGFTAGKVGIQPLGSFAVGSLVSAGGFDLGVGYLPGEDGGTSSFIGGDVIGIPQDAENVDASWDFIEWTLSDEVQVEIVAKSGELVSRMDLVQNKYSAEQPAVVAANEALEFARTPSSTAYQALIADPNGPFATMIQEGVFGEDVEAAVQRAQQAADAIG